MNNTNSDHIRESEREGTIAEELIAKGDISKYSNDGLKKIIEQRIAGANNLEEWQLHYAVERILSKIGREEKSLGTASLMCGILGFFTFRIVSIVAVICGHIALYRIRTYPNLYGGKRAATTGLTLGYIGISLAFIIVVIRSLVEGELGY